jgi:isopenicillin N synthase-like dioxygenase
MLSELKSKGYALLPYPPAMHASISEAMGCADEFFKDEAKKQKCRKLDHGRFPRGYYQTSQHRELFTTSVGFDSNADDDLDKICRKLVLEPTLTSCGWPDLRGNEISFGILARRALVEILSDIYDGDDLIQRIALSADESGGNVAVQPSVLTIINHTPSDNFSVTPPHVDRGLITLIVSRQGHGLEVRMPNSKAWQTVEEPGSLIVLAGHLLSKTTQGIVPASEHRVVAEGARLSMAYKLLPAEHARISWCSGVRMEHRPVAGDIMGELQGSVNVPHPAQAGRGPGGEGLSASGQRHDPSPKVREVNGSGEGSRHDGGGVSTPPCRDGVGQRSAAERSPSSPLPARSSPLADPPAGTPEMAPAHTAIDAVGRTGKRMRDAGDAGGGAGGGSSSSSGDIGGGPGGGGGSSGSAKKRAARTDSSPRGAVGASGESPPAGNISLRVIGLDGQVNGEAAVGLTNKWKGR